MLDNFRAWNRSRKIKRLKNKNLRKTIFGFDLVGPDVMTLPSESGSHNEMHNLVYGRISDEKDKSAVYAGI